MPCIDAPRAARRLVATTIGLAALSACHTPMPPDPRSVPVQPGAVKPLSKPTAPYLRPAQTLLEYRMQAAARLMAANPGITYTEQAPSELLAIPVLEIEVNADGSVRNIIVVRSPQDGLDTVQIAIDAVRRAAPFGDATHLPRPWKFTETFLFDEHRRFKPRILD